MGELKQPGLGRKIPHEAIAAEFRSLWSEVRRLSGTEGVKVVNRVASLDIGGLTADAAPDGAADYVAVLDSSGAVHRKVLLDNLPSASGATLAGLTDTAISGTPTNRFLRHNGTNWVDAVIGVGDLPAHTHTWAQITSTPTTLAGYGITDAAPLSHSHSAADITSGVLAVDRGGTGLQAVNLTTGDLIYSPDGAGYGGLGIGGANTALLSNGTLPSWGAITSAYTSGTFDPDPHTFDSAKHTGTLSLTKLALLADGAFIVGSGGGNTSRALVAGDIPDLSGTYSVVGHTHTGSQITDFEAYLEALNATVTGNWSFPTTFQVDGLDIGKSALSLTTVDAGSGYALDTGTSLFVRNTSLERPPGANGYGYWHILGRRDTLGGYSGLWGGYYDGELWMVQSDTTAGTPSYNRLLFAGTAHTVTAQWNFDLPPTFDSALGVDSGGTGLTTTNLTTGDLIYSPDGSSYGGLAIGSVGQVLKVATGPILQWGSVAWTEISGKPSTFPPSSHAYDDAVHTGTLSLTKLAALGDGAFIVGSVGGNTSRALLASDIPDLSATYATVSHNHSAADITSGVLAVDRGGTGLQAVNLTTGDLIYSPDGSSYGGLGIGSVGQVLKVATGPILSWGSIAWTEISGKPSTFPPSSHAYDDAVHTGTLSLTKLQSGAPGTFLGMTGATMEWQALAEGDIPSHDIITKHSASGLTTGHVLRASGATTFAFAAIAAGDLPSTLTPQHVAYTGQIYQSEGHQSLTNQTGTINPDWNNNDSYLVTMGAGALTIDVDLNAKEAGTYNLLVHGPATGSQNLTITGTGVNFMGGDTDYTTATALATGNAVRFTFIVGRNRADDTNIIEMYVKDLTSYPT